MPKRVIIMTFDVKSEAFQAFSEIKNLYAKRLLQGEQMAVVTHTTSESHRKHDFKIDDFIDFTGNNKTAKGSIIGMLVGILGGPLGVFLGWFAGSMFGATRDAKEIKDAQNTFEFVTSKIAEGQTGVILIANEEDNRLLNQIIMTEIGGEITRLDYDQVEKDLENASEIEKKTEKDVKENWKEKTEDTTTTTEDTTESSTDK
ncbi:MAG: DUF1269 domain-containing protein [Enterococcus sp.]